MIREHDNVDDMARRLSMRMEVECKSLRRVCNEEGLNYGAVWRALDRAGWSVCYSLKKYRE